VTTQPNHWLLACDLGGTHVRTAGFNRAGEMLDLHVDDTPREDPTAFEELLARRAEVLGRFPAVVIVGVPGPVDYANGEVLELPNLPGWEPHVAAANLARVIDAPVLLANDADLAALGVHRFGVGRSVDDLLYVTLGTGIGGAVIIGGRLLHGRRSLAEVGHMVVDRTTLETLEGLASGGAIERRTGVGAAVWVERAAGGDGEAEALLDETSRVIGIGVLNLVLSFMPQRVVLGGGLAQIGARLLEGVDLVLGPAVGKHGLGTADVVLAEHQHDVGLMGANALWHDISAGEWRAPTLRAFDGEGRPVTIVDPR
jgi:glucokinase